MKSKKPKVLCEVLFEPMLGWVLQAVREAGIEEICVVTGSRHEAVEEYLQTLPFPVQTVFQSERLGTGHAVMTARAFLEAHRDWEVLILNGDAPFMDRDTITAAFRCQTEGGEERGCTVISAQVENPFGYGRIVHREDTGEIAAIVEEKEADEQTRQIREVNSGAYWFCVRELLGALDCLTPSALTHEYYLTDTVEILRRKGKRVLSCLTENARTVLGANNNRQLSELNEQARRLVLDRLLEEGVGIPCGEGVLVHPRAVIGAQTVLLPATVISGPAVIGEECRLGPGVLIGKETLPDKTVRCPAVCGGVGGNS